MSHACHRFWKCHKTLTFCSLLRRCTIPCACHAKRHLNVQKWSRTPSVFNISTSKRALRHNGVHFFDISTSKSGPRMVCFVHFDFDMCFARKVSSLLWPDGSAPDALASLLLDPPEPQNIGKTQCVATFLAFRAPTSSFFWLFLFSDLLSSTLLFSLTLYISFPLISKPANTRTLAKGLADVCLHRYAKLYIKLHKWSGMEANFRSLAQNKLEIVGCLVKSGSWTLPPWPQSADFVSVFRLLRRSLLCHRRIRIQYLSNFKAALPLAFPSCYWRILWLS